MNIHPMTLSTNNNFIRLHFHPPPPSPLGTHVAGQRPATSSHKHGFTRPPHEGLLKSKGGQTGGRLSYHCRQENFQGWDRVGQPTSPSGKLDHSQSLPIFCVSHELFQRQDNASTILKQLTATGNTDVGESLYRISRSNNPRKASRPIRVVNMEGAVATLQTCHSLMSET